MAANRAAVAPVRDTAAPLHNSQPVGAVDPAKADTTPGGVRAAATKAQVASCVVAVPTAAVGAVGVPVRAGLASGAKEAATKAVVASCVELVPGAAVGPAGVPVNVGLASNAPPTPVTSAACKVTAPVRVLKLATPTGWAAMALATKAVVAMWVELSA